MIYTFRYPGNKFEFLKQILEIILKISDRCCLVEPFAGSGVVAVNMSKFFESTIMNDINKDVMDIHYALAHANNKDVNNFFKEFPNIHNIQNKKLYYQFRDAFNKKYYFSKNQIMRGLGLYYLAGACINSMFRIGPNGFNQSSGRRNLSEQLTPIRLRQFNDILGNLTLCNEDATDIILSYINRDDVTFFIDPPYNSTTLDYGIKNDKMKLLELLFKCKGNIIYTDYAIPEHHKMLIDNGFSYQVLRYNAPNIAVGDKATNVQPRHELIYFKVK